MSDKEEYSFQFLGQTVSIEVTDTRVFIEIGHGDQWTTLEDSFCGSPSEPAIAYHKQWLTGAASRSHRNKQLREYAEDAILRAIHRKHDD